MYYVVQNRIYATVKNLSEVYPLLSITIDSSGIVTITDEGEGIATIPAGYRLSTLEEVLAIFSITPTSGYKPFAHVEGYVPVTIYLDETNKLVTLTASNPSEGTFTGDSSDVDIVTESNTAGAFTLVPVAVGTATIDVEFTPTDTDFAVTPVSIPVTVAQRKVILEQHRDIQILRSTSSPDVSSTVTAIILSNVATPTITAYSSDEDNIEVSVTDQTITITAADDKEGEATITVCGAKTNAVDSDDMTFLVKSYKTATSAASAEPDDFNIEIDEEKEAVWTLPTGGQIVEARSSDTTKVEIVEITAKNKVKVKGIAAGSSTITVYFQQRCRGQISSTVTVTTVSGD